MRRRILAAIFGTAALFTFAGQSLAATITFTGVVDQVDAPLNLAHLTSGDQFLATLFFNDRPSPSGLAGGGPVSRYFLRVGDFIINEKQGVGKVAFSTGPSSGSVFYQLIDFGASSADPYLAGFAEITLQAATPDGMIPPIDQFNLNDFIISLTPPNALPESVLGHCTSLPKITNLVPESGTTISLFTCGLGGLALLRRYSAPRAT